MLVTMDNYLIDFPTLMGITDNNISHNVFRRKNHKEDDKV